MDFAIEAAYYTRRRPEWLESHPGEYALIVGNDLIGFYESSLAAYRAGVKARGNVPMFIDRIGQEARAVYVPLLMVRKNA